MPADFLLRPTEASDLPAIAEIYGNSVLTATASYELEPPGVEEMTRRWQTIVSKGFPHFVAVGDEGRQILGYAYAGPYHTRPGYRFTVEDSIYIARAAQRRGIGRALLSRLLEICEAKGFRQMIAVIGGTEPMGSVRLHSGLGFRQIGAIEGSGFKHGKWLDTVLMQRALGPGNSTLPEER
jgi:L-amino acid N-acyltransferase YncA